MWKLDPYWKWVSRSAGALVFIGLFAALMLLEITPVSCMGDGRRDVYGALLTTSGTLLGVSYAVTAMIIGFSDRKNLSVYIRSTDYPDIALMMRDANRALGLSAVAAFSLMIAEGSSAEAWLLCLLLGFSAWAFSVLGMAMNRFTAMLHHVAKSHTEEATSDYNKDMQDFLGSERQQGTEQLDPGDVPLADVPLADVPLASPKTVPE